MDLIELHEAFSATCLSIFKVGREKYGHHWESRWKDGKLNPHGGSIPLGHPLAATGTRVVLNALYQMKQKPEIKYALATACAAGGLGGANRSVGVAPKSIAGSGLVGRRLTFTVAFARLWGWIEGLIQLITGSVLIRPVMASTSAQVML